MSDDDLRRRIDEIDRRLVILRARRRLALYVASVCIAGAIALMIYLAFSK